MPPSDTQQLKQVMSELGKRSAHSPLRTKEYYAERGRKSAAVKKAKREQAAKEAKSPTRILSKFLHTGKI